MIDLLKTSVFQIGTFTFDRFWKSTKFYIRYEWPLN